MSTWVRRINDLLSQPRAPSSKRRRAEMIGPSEMLDYRRSELERWWLVRV
jgi:hypothetical protein